MTKSFFSLGIATRSVFARFFATAATLGLADIATSFSEESFVRAEQHSSVAATKARTASELRGPAQFFTINEILGNSSIRALRMPIPNDEPFGMAAFVQPEGQLSKKWHEIEVDLAKEEPILKECIADEEKCTSAAARFVGIIMNISQQIGRARLELANQEINSAIRYKSDAEQWGVPDLWSPPLTTFETGFGDCEDYAIAKFVALRQSGIPATDLRIVLGYASGQMSGHAILVARNEGTWLVLDNLTQRLLWATDIPGYVPLFVFDTRGVNMLAAPYIRQPLVTHETVGASAGKKGAPLPGGSSPGALLTH
jgi:predicted transglutaminase-like cysteine proteinase